MLSPLIYFIYNLLLPVFLIVGLPGYIVKGIKRGNFKRNFAQRFGRLPDSVKSLPSSPLWIHAVSVGEALVAVKVIRALRNESPDQPLVLTTTTTTGYNVAEKELANDALTIVLHNPVDLPWVVRSVVKQINPSKLIMIDSDIWPNLVNYLNKRGIPVLLANARLSPRSEKRYLKLRSLIEPVFSKLNRVAVPFDSDVDRWSALGIDREKITVSGSVKFDESVSEKPDAKIAELQSWLADHGVAQSDPIFLAGSTHAGEELACAKVWQNLSEDYPNLRLVIVPRHAERAPDFEAELLELGVKPIFRNYTEAKPCEADQKIYISDTTGELRAWFHLANVVFIGKSLTAKGCQNPVEPILCSKPVIVGPNTQNFLEVVGDLRSKEGISQVADQTELQATVKQFLDQPELGTEQASRGKTALEQHHGAAIRTAKWILED